ncbi:MAG: hypothetical protein IPH04_11165 [Saprospirales bacterium]|nr:hypothetical protein [Saprospirales bacterium]
MTRLLSYLPGPELYWLLVYGVILYLAVHNVPPTAKMDKLLLSLYWVLPLIVIPLAFSFFFISGIPREWLFLRTNIACLIGLFAAMSKGLDAHGEGGPGVGTAWMVGIGLGFVSLFVVNLVVKFLR